MSKYLLLYLADQSARKQMSQGTPEDRKAGMDAWMAWAGTAGDMIVEFGAPLQAVDAAEGKQVTGFSILEADSADALRQVLEVHPHHHMPGGVIAAYEMLSPPGM